jgi:hypothetical protein
LVGSARAGRQEREYFTKPARTAPLSCWPPARPLHDPTLPVFFPSRKIRPVGYG